jgi:hypothetical protein
MSSVSGSDSSTKRQDETIRRKGEDAKQRETELQKKHAREIRRLNEAHYKEVENLKQDHEQQIQNMQRQANDTINERDHRYNKEIEDVRNLHRRQAQSNAEEAQRREDALREATDDVRGHKTAARDQRIEQLNKDYNHNLRRLEEQYRSNLEAARESQANAIDGHREKLQNEHKNELKALKRDRDASVLSLQKQYADYRQNSEETLRDKTVQNLENRKRATENMMRAVQKERKDRGESEANMREGFEDGMAVMRDRFENSLNDKQKAMESARNEIEALADERVNGRMRRIEAENEQLKDDNIREASRAKHRSDREVANVKAAFQKNIDELQFQREEAIRGFNEQNRKDISSVRKEISDQLVTNNRFYRDKMSEQSAIHRNAYGSIKDDFDARVSVTKGGADARVQRILEETNQEKTRLVELQKENHMNSQRLHQDQIRALRETMESDKQEAVNRLQDQMRMREIQHTERMNLVVQKYEKQLQALKDQMVREKKSGDENLKRTVEDMQRVHKTALDQLEAKNREQMRQVHDLHQEQMRSQTKRYEEKLDQVFVEVKKT